MKPTGQTFGAAETESSSSAIQGHASPSVIYKPANWFEPLDWRAVFERNQPIEIDLGCGMGSFLLWAARTYIQREISWEWTGCFAGCVGWIERRCGAA